MERRRNSTNSDSSVEPMDISAKTTSTDANSSAVLKSSDLNDSDHCESDREDRLRMSRLAYRAAAAAAASVANLPANNTENDGDDDDDEEHQYRSSEYKHQNFVRRENLRQLEANMMSMRKKFRPSNPPGKNNNSINNNGQYDFEKFHPLVSRFQASIMAGGTLVENPELNTGLVDANENTTITNGKGEVKYSCPICDTVSTTQHEFTEHIRSHNNADDTQNFTCKICFKVRMYSRVGGG